MCSAVSIARRLPDISDTEIRNVVEGYASAVELRAQAEEAFERWWGAQISAVAKIYPEDAMKLAFVYGWSSMVVQLGRLPEGGAA